jgi:uncharacterized protein YbjT (DUF2867 family)
VILVVGGTGQLGGKVVELLRDNHPVRVMTRDPQRIPPPRPGVQVVRGDLRDGGSLSQALDGVDAVVCTAQGGESGGDNGPRYVEGTGVPRLVDAAARTGVRQFVYVSSASARPDSPSDFFRFKASAERHLRGSGLPYSILRPTHLMETWAAGLGEPIVKQSRAIILGRGDNPVSFVAAADVARAAATVAGQEGTGYTADLGGPEALTLVQVNDLLAEAFGVTVTRRLRLPVPALRLGSRLLRPLREVTSRQLLFGVLLDTQPQVVDSTAAWRHLGVTPTTMRAWLERHAPELAGRWGAPLVAPFADRPAGG